MSEKMGYRDSSFDDDDNGNDVEQSTLLADNAEKGQADSSMADRLPQHHEDTVSINKKLWYLLGYFICNIGLTLYNKAILGSVSHMSTRCLTDNAHQLQH